MDERLSVLLVEDCENDADLIIRQIRKAGYDVEHKRVETPDQMRAALESGAWHLVVADYNLPRLSANAALAILQESGLDVPFIVVSETIGEDKAIAMMKAGAHDYVRKESLALLGPAVARSLDGFAERRARREAEAGLRESEEHYRSLFDNMMNGYAYCRMLFDGDVPKDFVYLNVNKAFETLTGLRNVTGKNVTEVIPGIRESNPELFEIYGRVARTGKPERWEDYVESLGMWFSISAHSPKRDHFVALFEVITERKRAEEALRESEARYRRLHETMRDAFASVDLEGRLKEWNPAYRDLLQYSDEELSRLNHRDLTPPKWHDAEARIVAEEVVPLGYSRVYEKEYIRKDGVVIPIEIRTSLIRDEAGRPAAMWGIVRDITERKAMETALRESEARYQSLAEHSLTGIFVHTEGRYVYVNQRMAEMLGYTRDELIGSSAFEVLYPEDRERVRKLVDDREKSPNGASHYEARAKSRSGKTVWLEVLASVIDYQGGKAHMGNVVDITARKKAEEERARLEEQVRQSQRLEAVGTLAGGVAHDFNNLLTIILGNTDLTLTGLTESHSLYNGLAEIRHSAQRAASLTRQLLTFSRKQIVEPLALNMNDIIKGVEKMLGRLIGEHIRLEADPGPDLWSVYADPGQIEQVLVNLAVNAKDAMLLGGRLTMATRNVHLDGLFFSERGISEIPGPYVKVEVSDTGTGISPEIQGRIFDPFFTTKEVGKGTGLGLSIVYGIVKQNRGFIFVRSEPGKGATFEIYLPKAEAGDKSEEAKGALPDHSTASETILLVEDDDQLRRLVVSILRGKGYLVLEARGGEDALVVSQSHTGPIHLLLTDIVMPGMNGRELAGRLTSLRQGTRVLYMSGYTDDSIVQYGVLEQGVALLMKPFTPDGLACKVREVLDP